ncbi:DedA family protein [Paragemmobacter aquarius]|nr:VTT domain-containing protein [Gemmobacter aquarius]
MPEIGLATHGHLMLFLLAMLEGPVIVATTAALADTLKFHLGTIWIVALAADLAGDLLLYAAGRFLSHLIPHRFRILTPKPELTRLFDRSGGRILVVAKLTHVAGLPTLLAAGYARMEVLRFLGWNLAGTLPKVTLIVLGGWALGTGSILVLHRLGNQGAVLAALICLAIACGAVWKFYVKRKVPVWS